MVYVYLYGRLGNNLAQIGAAATLSHILKCDFAARVVASYWCPEPDNCYLNEYIEPYKTSIFRNVRFVDAVPEHAFMITDATVDKWGGWNETQIPEDQDIVLNGFFLNAKLINREICRNLFSVPDALINHYRRKYGISDMVGSVVVRRGDYLKIPHLYAICGKKYYKSAINMINQVCGCKIKWLIISDDEQWCKKVFAGNNFVVIEEPPLGDLIVPMLCSYNIISNSTFAWWSAFLNGNSRQICLYPKPWYFIGHSKLEYDIQNKFCSLTNWISVANINLYQMSRGILFYAKVVLRKFLGQLFNKIN